MGEGEGRNWGVKGGKEVGGGEEGWIGVDWVRYGRVGRIARGEN